MRYQNGLYNIYALFIFSDWRARGFMYLFLYRCTVRYGSLRFTMSQAAYAVFRAGNCTKMPQAALQTLENHALKLLPVVSLVSFYAIDCNSNFSFFRSLQSQRKGLVNLLLLISITSLATKKDFTSARPEKTSCQL